MHLFMNTLRYSLSLVLLCLFWIFSNSVANACVKNMDMVKTTTALMADADYDGAHKYITENLDVCPMQARFFLARLIVEGKWDAPVCEAVALLEETFFLNKEINSEPIIVEANEKSSLQLLDWVYLERYIEVSMIEGNAYSLNLFLKKNEERFSDVLSYTDQDYYTHRRLIQLLTYAEYLDVDVNDFPELLQLVGNDFKRDNFLIENGWPKKIICDVRERVEQ